MVVNFYTFEPLDISLRSTFELPDFPYDEEGEPAFRRYMQGLKAMRYIDDLLEYDGRDVGYAINFEISNKVLPVTAYFSSVAVDDETLKVIDWPRDFTTPSRPDVDIDINQITSDNKAWFSWNTIGEVKQWEGQIFQFAIDRDLNVRVGGQGECFKSQT